MKMRNLIGSVAGEIPANAAASYGESPSASAPRKKRTLSGKLAQLKREARA